MIVFGVFVVQFKLVMLMAVVLMPPKLRTEFVPIVKVPVPDKPVVTIKPELSRLLVYDPLITRFVIVTDEAVPPIVLPAPVSV